MADVLAVRANREFGNARFAGTRVPIRDGGDGERVAMVGAAP